MPAPASDRKGTSVRTKSRIRSWAQPFPRTWMLRPSTPILERQGAFVNRSSLMGGHDGSRESERDQGVTLRLFGHRGMAAGGNDEKLPSAGFGHVGHRRGSAAGGQWRFPDLPARLDVESTDKRVNGPGDEDQSSRSDNRAAQADRSRGNRRMTAAKILHRAERYLPPDFALAQINGREQAPGRRRTRQVRWSLNESAKQAVGRSGLGRVLTVFVAMFVIFELGARDEPDLRGQVIHIG